MTNLISGGLSYALMSADSSARSAVKPMNMVSRELRKQNPDFELIERAGKYGGNELSKAEEALVKAREELKEAQDAARQKEKAELKERLQEKAVEKSEETESQETTEAAAGESGQTSEKNQDEVRIDIVSSAVPEEWNAETVPVSTLGSKIDLRG